jgi:hypothetical protein
MVEEIMTCGQFIMLESIVTIQIGEVILFKKNIQTTCAIIKQTMMRSFSWAGMIA